ncbi:hypothetical protein RHMOL_Rhmol07G0184600 [Rhododendron molle]|uniref:Uncharacterized protein n=1 Tax=Rhododendron molle TaxID=49168 RepID=A0ACC0N2E6_RHOML|nr:hypothetical protein RHMOL_Rhmol07G0184600 [Rhododendron molle]
MLELFLYPLVCQFGFCIIKNCDANLQKIFASPIYEYLDTRYGIKGSALAFLFNKRLCAK